MVVAASLASASSLISSLCEHTPLEVLRGRFLNTPSERGLDTEELTSLLLDSALEVPAWVPCLKSAEGGKNLLKYVETCSVKWM